MIANPLTDGETLLAAIRANKADDAPRLVYADWLDERGQVERAEFVRAQCELAQTNPARRRPRGRERQLLHLHWWKWYPRCIPSPAHCLNFAAHPGGPAVGVEFRRGFVAHVAADLATLVGGPCEQCEATGIDPDNTSGGDLCPACHGTGRGTGILRELLKREPVETCRAVDKHPEHTVRGSGLPEWTWFVGDVLAQSSAAHITNELWRLMGSLWYRSEEESHAALSRALLAYATAARGSTTPASAADARPASADGG